MHFAAGSITFTVLSQVQGSFSFTLVLSHPAVCITCLPAVARLLSPMLSYLGRSTAGNTVLHKAQVTLRL